MRILNVLFFVFVFVSACNNDNKNTRKPDKPKSIDSSFRIKDSANNSDKKLDRSFSWTKKEQNKFLAECSSGSEHHFTTDKLKSFCDCMLIQSQKYYRTYNEMENESNEEDDVKILAGCQEYFDEDENHD